MNNIKNSNLVAGIDIGSENIYCAIGSPTQKIQELNY